MMKSRSNQTQLLCLRAETKIMMHIGRHVNIVNLLGACTDNMASKGELWLIVEYCRYGNILNYMRSNKTEFVNQLNAQGDLDIAAYFTLPKRGSVWGKSQYSPGASQAAGDSGARYVNCRPDSGGREPWRRRTLSNSSKHAPEASRKPTRRSTNSGSSNGDVIPEQSNSVSQPNTPVGSTSGSVVQDKVYENAFDYTKAPDHPQGIGSVGSAGSPTRCDRSYSRDTDDSVFVEGSQAGSPMNVVEAETYKILGTDQQNYQNEIPSPSTVGSEGYHYVNTKDSLTTRKLLGWCFQIANGMGYLANKKVLHGDLAARNILLADNDIVKISDFGMAKDIYKDEQYTKQSKTPMPVKWMSIEAIVDGVYSTQSDVWSFGVVMWEVFTLGQVPYPAQEIDKHFVESLINGARLDKPKYAPNQVYEQMKLCWTTDPLRRPLFDTLTDNIGEMMNDAHKQFITDQNRSNMELSRSDSSILNKVRSPDIRAINATDDADGYVVPKEVEEVETSAGSVMSRRNIKGLSISAPSQEEPQLSPAEYLAMNSPKRVSPQSASYTRMNVRSATPARTAVSPTANGRSFSLSPTIHEDRVFQFPPTTTLQEEVAATPSYRAVPFHDSGVYSASTMMENREYFFPAEVADSSAVFNDEDINEKINRELQKTYIELQRKYSNRTPRDRTASNSSSGMGSIDGDPCRESLLRSVSVHSSIPEDNAITYV